MPSTSRLSKQDWIDAAVPVLAAEGPRGVSVERLARQLGVTKGSFYWHFTDHADLVRECIAYWQRVGVDEPIAGFADEDDPLVRLRGILAIAFGSPRMPLEPAILMRASQSDEIAHAAADVLARRLEFLVQCYRDCGLDDQSARNQALAVYSLYIGQAVILQLEDDRLRIPFDVIARLASPDDVTSYPGS